jgi:hypothetical protein
MQPATKFMAPAISLLCECSQDRVHEVGVVTDVLDFAALDHSLEKFKGDSRSAKAALGKYLTRLENRFVWWPVPEMEHVVKSPTLHFRSHAAHINCSGKGWMQAHSWAYGRKMRLPPQVRQTVKR